MTKDKCNLLLFSPTLWEMGKSRKITYLGVATALSVSFTMFFSVFVGVLLGGIAGFCTGFLGDLIGFFLHPMGEYSPWIGISTGLMAFFAGLCVHVLFTQKRNVYIKLAVACLLIFVICTCGITTLYLNLVWVKGMTYFEYLFTRLFVQGQIINSLVNCALAIWLIPYLSKIKPLGIKL